MLGVGCWMFNSMLHRTLAFLLAVSLSSAHAVELGIDMLRERGFDILQGKRVGLVTNQTGVDAHGTKTRVILKKAAGVNLVALFSPEHGLDGVAGAGRAVGSHKDGVTGLTTYSLYGATRKPTRAMLAGLDVLVYDMQDIGCRSYTYISTMAKCMEAAGEAGIEFVVLDRPNPLGGERVEGPPIEGRWISFVGIFPTPYVHGMTAGELAQMANARGWTGARCKLTVVPMRGWSRGMTWPETGLRWVQTSPNIPHATSPFYYVATGLVGELHGVEVGCGGGAPFECCRASGVDGAAMAARLRSAGYPGVGISPLGNGVNLNIAPHAGANLCKLATHLILESNRGANLLARYHDPEQIFYKCYGSTSIKSQVQGGASIDKIVAGWESGNASFRAARRGYLLY